MAKKLFTTMTVVELENDLRERGYLNTKAIPWINEIDIVIWTNEPNKAFVQGHRKASISEKEIEDLKQAKANGVTDKELAKKYKCCVRTIKRYLQK